MILLLMMMMMSKAVSNRISFFRNLSRFYGLVY